MSTRGWCGQRDEQRAQRAGGGALADRHAAGEADEKGDLLFPVAEEGRGRAVEALHGGDVEVEQAGEGEVHLLDLAEGHALDEAVYPPEVLVAESERGVRAQRGPLVA